MNEIKSNFKKTILSIVACTLLWAFASVSFFAMLACSPPEPGNDPPYPSPGAPTDDGPDIATGCGCTTAPTKVRGPSQGDWPQGDSEQEEIWDWWVAEWEDQGKNSSAWTKSGNFTNGFNCYGAVFANGDHWVTNASNYIGTEVGCWEYDATNGTHLYDDDEDEEHACTVGYVGKCGHGPTQDHNDDLYPEITDAANKIKKITS